MNFPYYNEYENIQNDFIQESAESIDCIFGESISEEQKQELLNSFSLILEKSTKEYLNDPQIQSNTNNFISLPNNFSTSSKSNPKINLILFVPPANYRSYAPYQPQYVYPTAQTPYQINTSPNQLQMANPLQPYQQPNLQFFCQPQMMNQFQLFQTTTKKHTKNKKSKNKKHDHKKSSKTKSSKSKKEEKDTKKDKETKEIKEESKQLKEVTTFSFHGSHNFTGVVNYLKSHGGIENMIGITSSSQESDTSLLPRDSVSHMNGNVYFKSKNQPNSWICLDFKEFRISPTRYTIGTTNDSFKLRNWVIEGSNDNKQWKTISTQKNCTFSKRSNNCVFVFATTNSIVDRFRYLRLRMNDINWSNNNFLCLNSFEIYGTLFK